MKKGNAPFGGIVIKEDLPNPFVFYPWSGPWLEFRKREENGPVLCACFMKAFQNYLQYQNNVLEHYDHHFNYRGKTIRTILNPNFFSSTFMEMILSNGIEADPDKIFQYTTFSPGLCHLCNKKTPTIDYCMPMYGGVFVQTFGWYVNKYKYEFGLMYIYENLKINKYVDKGLPKHIQEKVIEYDSVINMNIPESRDKMFYDVNNESAKNELKSTSNIVSNMIENYVRDICGYKRIGEGWLSETLLSQIIEQIYPKYKITRHYRHPALKGLELDVYINDINVGVEYQGIQHFEPVEHWGGEVAFYELQERDKKKKLLCEQNNIKLIYVNYYDELSIDNVRKLLPCI